AQSGIVAHVVGDQSIGGRVPVGDDVGARGARGHDHENADSHCGRAFHEAPPPLARKHISRSTSLNAVWYELQPSDDCSPGGRPELIWRGYDLVAAAQQMRYPNTEPPLAVDTGNAGLTNGP